jgi:hypothetical protein
LPGKELDEDGDPVDWYACGARHDSAASDRATLWALLVATAYRRALQDARAQLLGEMDEAHIYRRDCRQNQIRAAWLR